MFKSWIEINNAIIFSTTSEQSQTKKKKKKKKKTVKWVYSQHTIA